MNDRGLIRYRTGRLRRSLFARLLVPPTVPPVRLVTASLSGHDLRATHQSPLAGEPVETPPACDIYLGYYPAVR